MNDTPADKATYTFRLTVPKPYTATASGVLAGIEPQGSGQTFVWKMEQPMASYVAAVNVGEFTLETSHVSRGGQHPGLLRPRPGDRSPCRFCSHRGGDRLLRKSVRPISLPRLRGGGPGRRHHGSYGESDSRPFRAQLHQHHHGRPDLGPHLPFARTGPSVVREQRHHRAVGRHLAERGVCRIRELAVAGARPGAPGAAGDGGRRRGKDERVGRAANGPSRAERHVRGQCLPARRPDPSRPSAHGGRRQFLPDLAYLDRALQIRQRRYRRLHRPGQGGGAPGAARRSRRLVRRLALPA